MKIVNLVSAVNQNVEQLTDKMNLETDAIVVNQCDYNAKGEYDTDYGHITWECMDSRGVGLNRNTCISHITDEDIILFSDEDIIYDAGYVKTIASEYEAHPEADGILFNVRVDESRRTYWNEDFHRINVLNYGRYPAYSISIKREALNKSGVLFPLEFGGGAKYCNGEDSIFLHDLLQAGVKLYRTNACIGGETLRESTWFKGYDEHFFISRGALYVKLYGRMDIIMAWVFLLRHRYMTKEIGLFKAIKLMKQGIREMRR